MKVRYIYLLIVLLLGAILFGMGFRLLPYTSEKKAPAMGTSVRIKVRAPGAAGLVRQALEEIQRLERLFSRFDRASEIYRFNAGEKIELSEDTRAVLETAERVGDLSRGAFNVRYRGGKIDLGGVAKGYAVERVRQLLLKRGVKSAIIDMHSSIAVIGNNWKIGIQDPRDKNNILGIIKLENGDALSTSGGYEQPGHIIDPRSGKPADKCLSVTVIARDAALADALSTAIFVLGPNKGMKLAQRLNAKALVIDKDGKVYDNIGPKLR